MLLPYTITGINDQGLLVGNLYGNNFAFLGSISNPNPNLLPLSAEGGAYLTSVGVSIFGFPGQTLGGGQFLGIDNQNRILANLNGQRALFVPVPEPLTVSTFGGGLAAIAGIGRWRKRDANKTRA